ncbi:MAG: DUF4180 domain-containing protein [Bacteroidia bacterium]|nr:DUF4180 domain-containing protein [Bacteroidia bacterium]
MIKYHDTPKGAKIAELVPGSDIINNVDDMLDILANSWHNECHGIILHEGNLNPDFFDLKTRLAGEILQKFSNYRTKLAIIGDFSDVKSKSLRDFIRESNSRGTTCFVSSFNEALSKLNIK